MIHYGLSTLRRKVFPAESNMFRRTRTRTLSGPPLDVMFKSRPVGLMDKASASGAGDSRFESWAGHMRIAISGLSSLPQPPLWCLNDDNACMHD